MYLVDWPPSRLVKRAWSIFNLWIGKQALHKCPIVAQTHFGGVEGFGGSHRALPST